MPATLRSALTAIVPLVAAIGFSTQTVLGAGLDPYPTQLQPQVLQLQPAGTILKSPNGQFSLSITDAGIVMSGPGGSVLIDDTKVQVSGASNVTIQSSQNVTVSSLSNLTLKSAASTQLYGSMIDLNGSCRPIARSGDTVISTAPSGGGTAFGTIVNGSGNVFAC